MCSIVAYYSTRAHLSVVIMNKALASQFYHQSQQLQSSTNQESNEAGSKHSQNMLWIMMLT